MALRTKRPSSVISLFLTFLSFFSLPSSVTPARLPPDFGNNQFARMGLSEEEEKRRMMVHPQDHEKSSLWGWKKVELHSACAQSVQHVSKRLWKVHSQLDALPLSLLLSNVLYLIRMMAFYLLLHIKMVLDVLLPLARLTYLCSSGMNYV